MTAAGPSPVASPSARLSSDSTGRSGDRTPLDGNGTAVDIGEPESVDDVRDRRSRDAALGTGRLKMTSLSVALVLRAASQS